MHAQPHKAKRLKAYDSCNTTGEEALGCLALLRHSSLAQIILMAGNLLEVFQVSQIEIKEP